jgi:excisionase family DNA binding protein
MSNKTEINYELLTVSQCAECLNITTRHARHLFATRAFPVVKVGRLVRVRKSDLDTYLAQNVCGVRL